MLLLDDPWLAHFGALVSPRILAPESIGPANHTAFDLGSKAYQALALPLSKLYEVLISWAAHDWAGRPWADEWQPITFLKRQRGGEGNGLYERARAMEAAKYALERVAAHEVRGGERRSPRLGAGGTEDGE